MQDPAVRAHSGGETGQFGSVPDRYPPTVRADRPPVIAIRSSKGHDRSDMSPIVLLLCVLRENPCSCTRK